MNKLIKNMQNIELEYDFELDITKEELLSIENKNSSIDEFEAIDFIEKEKINNINYKELVGVQFDKKIDINDKWDYIIAILSGMLCGIIDDFCVKGFSLKDAQTWGTEEIEKFVISFSKSKGCEKETIKEAIAFLEREYISPSDAATDAFGGGLQHHLRDFEHHASPIGLFFSILSQFTHKGYGTNTNGEFIVIDIPDDKFVGDNYIEKIYNGSVVWLFHLISDMAGSSTAKGNGTGIPGILLSVLKEISTLKIIKDIKVNYKDDEIGLCLFISKLFNGTYFKGKTYNDGIRMDLRTEFGTLNQLSNQALPVVVNECIVRGLFSLRRFYFEIKEKEIDSLSDLYRINYIRILPYKNPTLNRMLTISAAVFEIMDVGYAAAYAKVKAGDNESLFAKEFLIRINIPGIVRFGIACSVEVEMLKNKTMFKKAKDIKVISELKEMTLKGNQIKILYSLEAYKCKCDIDSTNNIINKTFKKIWHENWKELISQELDERMDYFVEDENKIVSMIENEMRLNKDNSWMDIVVLESLLFKPYFVLGIEEDSKFKNLKFNYNYANKLKNMHFGYSKEEISSLFKNYNKYNNLLTNRTRNTIIKSASLLGVTLLSGGLCYAFAPSVAVFLVGSSFAGLSGAALTSASLAMIGGGALAVGGLGMAGGVMILTGGGALIGLSLGGLTSTACALLMSNSKHTLNECSKLLTFISKNILPKKENKESIEKLIKQLRSLSKSIVEEEIPNDLEDKNKIIKQIKKSSKYIDRTAYILEKEFIETDKD